MAKLKNWEDDFRRLNNIKSLPIINNKYNLSKTNDAVFSEFTDKKIQFGKNLNYNTRIKLERDTDSLLHCHKL